MVHNAVLLACVINLGLALGCATGNCRETEDAAAKKKMAAETAPLKPGDIPVTKPTAGPNEKAKVYKYDGSLQCGMGKAISPEEMKKELGKIRVHSAISKADGLMHIQQCGTPTGQVNIFEIDKTDLAAAKKLGFKEWTMD